MSRKVGKIAIVFLSVFYAGIYNSAIAQVDSCKVIVEKINNALNNNEPEELYSHFNQKIELSIPGQSGINSSNQARMVLNRFFRENPTKSFYIVSKNYNTQGVFIVGTLNTESQRYRLSFLIRSNQSEQLIYQLSIEK